MAAPHTPVAGATTLSLDDLDTLKSNLRGSLLTPGSPDYDGARTIWNAMIDRRPAAIARCADADDVASAVRYAAERRQLLAIRGGGHNIAGNAVCDGGLMIDLSRMNTVSVNPQDRTARVGGGATLADVDRETQKFGLVTPLGINSTTGVAGLTLGGGFGWLSRSLGLTIDSLQAAAIVTADGRRVRASATENDDLFWAIRGGGGNFGMVTSFEFRLHEIVPQVLAGLVVHPLDAAPDVLGFYREFIETTPENFVCWFVMRKAPPLPAIPAEYHGKEILALAMCYAGPIAEGERVAKPLRSYGRPVADMVGPVPFATWQTALDPLLVPGMRNYWKSNEFMTLTDGLIDAMVSHARQLPDPQTEIAFAQLGGAVSRVPADATAYGHRNARFVINVHGRWADQANDDECIGWARSLFQATTPFATGDVYVNFLTADEQDRVRAAYGDNYDRLAGIKTKYDPTNLFRMNQNIKPAA
jgi:FAD/FMN-containing dehydrogenase